MIGASVTTGETVNETVNGTVNDDLDDAEKLVLEIIRENPTATYEEIAEAASKGRTTIYRIVADLKKRGYLKREGSDKTGHWVICK